MNKVTKILIVIALIAAVGVVFAMKQKGDVSVNVVVNNDLTTDDQPQTSQTPSPAKTEPNVMTNSQPVKAVAALPLLMDLGADKCIPCKMMTPILDELKEDYKGQLDVKFIDVWKSPAAGQKYNIDYIPVQIFFDANGTELFRHVGFFAKEDILAKWKELGINLEQEK